MPTSAVIPTVFRTNKKGLVPAPTSSDVSGNKILRADGTWTTAGSGSPGGSTTQVQYNSSGSFAGAAGFLFDGTSAITLGVAGTSVGGVAFKNATSGTITLQPVTGALGTVTLSLPAATGTLLYGGGPLGTPASGTVTNLTGTASININGTVGATTPTTGVFTTLVAGSTTSLLLGTAGSAVGNVGFRNATSGTATVAPPTGALGTYTVTLPNAASTLPIFGQQITFAGPTAARTVTFPDASFTAARTDAANTFTGVQTMTSPSITTSLVTASTTFALVNTTATTVNFAGGASVALNIGNASGTTSMLGILGVNGATASSSTSLIVPASSTSVSSLRVPHGSAPSSPVNGDVWTTTSGMFARINGSTVGPFGTASGTVTVVASGSLTSTALVTGGGSQTIQTPSATATLDSSGNLSTPGTGTFGSSASTAGAVALTQGTTQSTGTTNITIQAPTSVTSYIKTLEGSAGSTGFYLGTVSGTTVTESKVASTGSGNVVLATSATLVTPILGTPTSGTLTNCTGLPVAGGGTGLATTTAYSPVFSGTTATGTWKADTGPGSSGQVLTSNGAGAYPTWQAASSGAAMFTSAGTQNIGNGTTYCQMMGGTSTATQSSTQTAVAQPIPRSGTLSNLYVTFRTGGAAYSASVVFVCTVVKNAVDQALTCTLTANGTLVTASDTNAGHGFSVSAGDLISLKVVGSGSPASGSIDIACTIT